MICPCRGYMQPLRVSGLVRHALTSGKREANHDNAQKKRRRVGSIAPSALVVQPSPLFTTRKIPPQTRAKQESEIRIQGRGSFDWLAPQGVLDASTTGLRIATIHSQSSSH